MIKFSVNSATVLKKIVEFKNFSRLLSDFPVLFKAFNFQGLFNKALTIQVLFKLVRTLHI